MISSVITPQPVSQFTEYECWCAFLMMAASSRNMQQRIDVMYKFLCVQVVGFINSNNLVNFNFSPDMKIFFYIMLINVASLNTYIYILYVYYFCRFISSFKVSIRYINVLQLVPPPPPTPLPGTTLLLAQPMCTREHTRFILPLTLAPS